MKVFKFGGASVKHAAAIRNVAHVLSLFKEDRLLIVVSAMGKTTNALERIVALGKQQKDFRIELDQLLAYHRHVIEQLLPAGNAVNEEITRIFNSILTTDWLHEYDSVYDQVVSLGEVASSKIVAAFLQHHFSVEWVDARTCIATDSSFREGKVNWEQSEKQIQQLVPILASKLIVTQGFIGCTETGLTTTLGREGSDFSAAIFGYCLNAESVTIWKDVPGVMNADPKRLPAAIVFDELPFKEAAEMTYYGASVIHPKTIKPLANKGIPLLVKNFDDPSLPGTRITECKVEKLPPLIVFKDNQCLITCKVTDYTFVNEEQLSTIFKALAELDIKINLMQNSAITFSFCVDYRESKVTQLIAHLSHFFEVYYNTGLTLVTVKNYDTQTFDEYRSQRGLLLEQSSRSTLQVLIRNSVAPVE